MSEFHDQAVKDAYSNAVGENKVGRLRNRLKGCLVFDIPKDIDSLMWDSRPSSFNAMPDATHNRQILEAYSVGLDASQATIAKLRELLNIAAPYMRTIVAAKEMEAIDAALTERP
jgi:hypothetical protein